MNILLVVGWGKGRESDAINDRVVDRLDERIKVFLGAVMRITSERVCGGFGDHHFITLDEMLW